MESGLRILLLNPPGRKIYLRDLYCPTVSKTRYLWPPGDLFVQSGILAEKHLPMVLDAIAENLSPRQTLQKIANARPDLILFVTSSISWEEDRKILQTIKNEFNPLLFGSGDILQFSGPDIMRENSFLDGIILDLLSDSIPRFLEKTPARISNLIYRTNGEIILGPRIRESSAFTTPIGKYELFPIDRYSLPFGKRGRWGFSYTSYGCPHNCQFCPIPDMGFRLRELDNIVLELQHLKSLRIRNLFFRDSSLTNAPAHTLKLLERIHQSRLGFNWICHSRADTVNRSLLQAMKTAGCSLITFGIESGDPELRKKYKITMSDAEIMSGFALCRDLGIKTLAHFIIGLPGENPETLQRTSTLARKLNCDFASFNLFEPRSQPVRSEVGSPAGQFRRAKNKLTRKFYLRPGYLWSQLVQARSPGEIFRQALHGLRLLVTRG